MKKLLILVILGGGLIYFNTAVIQGTGGPGENLVIKPLHGFFPSYGGGEETSWIRAHPGEALPWWHYPNKDYVASLIYTSSETTTPTWMIVYGVGYYLWLLAALSMLVLAIYRMIKEKTEPSAPAPPEAAS